MKVKKHYYTDGSVTIKVAEGEEIPFGFHKGRTFKSNPWNRGLTKETDDRVKDNAQKTSIGKKNSKCQPHNKGKTKDDYLPLQIVSEKMKLQKTGAPSPMQGKTFSYEHRQNLSNALKGRVPHNKGKSKDEYEPLMRTSEKMIGHPYTLTKEQERVAVQKMLDTKRKNKSFNKSIPEENLYESLVLQYGYDDVVRQYVDDVRYPFPCDFYIKSQDLFIEYNGTIEHNRQPYNPSDEEHQKQLTKYIQKATQAGENSRYWNIIYVWTVRDPLKLKMMRDNNLNFLVIYPNDLQITQ